MEKIFGVNWLPKVTGLLGGVALALAEAWQNGTLVITPKGIITFVVVTVLGFVVKAHNVTGIGDKATTDTAKDATQPTNLAGV